jgi:hypothetical protein
MTPTPTPTQIAEAPAHNLPKWKECERVIESQNETPLDRFIYEYDDSDGLRSDWFMHRLELVIEDARKQALAKQATEIAALKYDLDTERMRLAACGIVAMANTPESASKAREMHPAYTSASCGDVANAVDKQMALRAQIADFMPFAKFGARVMRDFSALTITKINNHALSQNFIGNGNEVKPNIEATITKLLKEESCT